jgi:small neutral amino acid transporter SnatA (MarC family)
MIVNRLVSEILFGFTGLIGIINPIGIAFLFLERTEALTEHERNLLAQKVAFNAFIVLLVAFFAGTPVLHFFGISMEALRIGAASRSPSPAGRCSTSRTARPAAATRRSSRSMRAQS